MTKNYLRFPKLSQKLGGRSRASIFRDMRDRGFPKPHRLGPNFVAWLESEVDAWIESLNPERSITVPRRRADQEV